MQGNPVFMEQAIALAIENVNSGRGGPFGAVIVRNGEIWPRAPTLSPQPTTPPPTLRSSSIRNACAALGDFSLQGCEIYTSCEPCPMCLAAIYWARMDAIFYGSTAADAAAAGFDDAFLYDEMKPPDRPAEHSDHNLLRDQAISSFNAWREFDRQNRLLKHGNESKEAVR